MLVDAWRSKPLTAASSHIVKMSIKSANKFSLDAPAHQVAGKVHPSHTGKAHPHAIAKLLADQTPYVGSLSPAQVRRAYGFDQSPLTGAGQTIAIIDAYDNPTIARDLQTFSQRYGLPAANLLKAVPTSGKPKYDAGWAGEIALDVEWAHAIAPGATILLFEAKSASYADLLSAVDYAVSMGAK